MDFCGNFLASTLLGVLGGLATALLLKSARLGRGSGHSESTFKGGRGISLAFFMVLRDVQGISMAV